MSNFSAKVLRDIVAKEFKIDPTVVRVSGCIGELPTYKNWYGFYQFESCFIFKKIEQGIGKPIFLVSVYKGNITVHG
ncbi:MAG: hypothetical protein WC011_02300 [Candidatus Paceibacterota bacterium]